MREEPSWCNHLSWKVQPLIVILGWFSLKHVKLRGCTWATAIFLHTSLFSSPTQTPPPTSSHLGSAHSFQIQKLFCDYRNFQVPYPFLCSSITFKWQFWLLRMNPSGKGHTCLKTAFTEENVDQISRWHIGRELKIGEKLGKTEVHSTCLFSFQTGLIHLLESERHGCLTRTNESARVCHVCLTVWEMCSLFLDSKKHEPIGRQVSILYCFSVSFIDTYERWKLEWNCHLLLSTAWPSLSGKFLCDSSKIPTNYNI